MKRWQAEVVAVCLWVAAMFALVVGLREWRKPAPADPMVEAVKLRMLPTPFRGTSFVAPRDEETYLVTYIEVRP